MTRALDVYIGDDIVGQLVQDDGGQMSFTYAEGWLKMLTSVPLSQSLPLRAGPFKGKECRGFFGGILPEEAKREIIARNLGISARNDYAMLERIGGECAGAVTFVPTGGALPEKNYDYRKLTDRELAANLRELPKRPLLAGDKGIRLSLAGAQDKVAVRIEGGEVSVPLGGAPSTHILKPAVERFEGVVFNEALCIKLAAAAGLPAAAVETRTVEGIDFLVVERYDRLHGKSADGKPTIERLHQEDFLPGARHRLRTEIPDRGRPVAQAMLRAAARRIERAGHRPGKALDAVIFNYLVGNNDAHGKNYSLLYKPLEKGGRETRFSPLYDIVSTVYYSDLSRDMAMKIGSECSSEKIAARHFEQLAEEAGLGKALVRRRVPELADTVIQSLAKVEIANPTAEKVAALIRERCEKARDFA